MLPTPTGTNNSEKNMNFEIQLSGYNGESEATDDLILWVQAPSEQEILDTIKPIRGMVDKTRMITNEIVGADAILPHDADMLLEIIAQRYKDVNRDKQIEKLVSALEGLMPLREREAAVYDFEANFIAAQKALEQAKPSRPSRPLRSYTLPHTIIATDGYVDNQRVMEFQAEDQGHAIEQLIDCYRMTGQKLIEVRADPNETDTVLHQIGERDFVMSPLLNESDTRSIWMEVGNIAVQITRTIEKIETHICPAASNNETGINGIEVSFDHVASILNT